jgi:DNA-binding MarR family transcriptional regulator
MERDFSTSALSNLSDDPHETLPSMSVTGEAAELLSDPLKALYLYPFIGKERTASDVAREYNLTLGKVLYQIKRLVKLGLLRVTRLEPRDGSSVKYYRSTADAFYVPFEATNQASLEDLLNRWSLALQSLFVRSFVRALSDVGPQWGVRISRDINGRLSIMPAARADSDWDYFAPHSPVLLEGWYTDLRLDLADAKAMQQELIALYLKYYGREGAQRYIVRVALAPMADAQELPPEW